MDTLQAGQSLTPGQSLKSKNGYHVLAMQTDGNLVLYSLGYPIWSTKTNGKSVGRVQMQTDGNLVLYSPGNKPLWASNTEKGPSALIMQDDRNLVIYPKKGPASWSTGTNTDPAIWQDVKVTFPAGFIDDAEDDPAVAFYVIILRCSVTLTGAAICVGAMVVIAAIFEWSKGTKAWGKNNDLRVIGGKISNAAKKEGGVLSDWAKERGGALKKAWDKYF